MYLRTCVSLSKAVRVNSIVNSMESILKPKYCKLVVGYLIDLVRFSVMPMAAIISMASVRSAVEPE